MMEGQRRVKWRALAQTTSGARYKLQDFEGWLFFADAKGVGYVELDDGTIASEFLTELVFSNPSGKP